jgi:cytochrome-b5 reductase
MKVDKPTAVSLGSTLWAKGLLDAKGFIELVVKKYPDGPMSSHLHDMRPEQRLEFKGPIPKYPWSPNKHNHIALIAGGTGITP